MARTGLVASKVAEALQWPHATVVGYMDSLSAAGLLPKGTRGRGQTDGRYESSHLTNLLLGFGGPLPSDAAEAATLAGSLVYTNPSPDASKQGSCSLGEGVEKLIEFAASNRLTNDLPAIELCFNPLHARWVWTFPDGLEKADIYKPEAWTAVNLDNSSRLHRGGAVVTIKRIYPQIIRVMGQLLRDTLEQQQVA